MTIELVLILLLLLVLLGQLVLIKGSLRSEQRHRSAMQQEVRGLFNQLESSQFLRDRLNLREGLPYTHDWSAAPDFLKLIAEHSLEHQPQTILECSSGLTSLVLARCCELNGGGHVYSLENGDEYAARSRSEIERYRLSAQATVIDAPLRRYQLDGGEYQWYATDDIPEGSIEMLVIDGPPGFIQKHSRYPALPLLYARLADGCVVFLDDAARPDEKAIVQMWQAQFPGVEHYYLKNERGCSVLTIRKG